MYVVTCYFHWNGIVQIMNLLLLHCDIHFIYLMHHQVFPHNPEIRFGIATTFLACFIVSNIYLVGFAQKHTKISLREAHSSKVIHPVQIFPYLIPCVEDPHMFVRYLGNKTVDLVNFALVLHVYGDTMNLWSVGFLRSR